MAKKLYRSRTDSMIAGVCGGLAEYFEIDATLVRLAAVALTLAGGSGILAYLILWLVVPQKPLASSVVEGESEKQTEAGPDDSYRADRDMAMLFVGVLLTILGFIFLVGNFVTWAWFSFRKLWPLILIAVGIFIVFRGSGSKGNES